MKQKVVFNNKALPPPLEEEKDTFADHIMNVSHSIESSIKIKEEDDVKLLKKRKRIDIKNIEKSIGYDISRTMLGSCTRSDFSEIRQTILKSLNLNDNDLPSFYYITLQRLKMYSRIVQIKDKYKILTRELKIK